MAAETGSTADVVKRVLLANGEKYAYFQAVRLLRLYDKQTGARQENLRVRPKLALGFPENDIDRIEVMPQGGYRITANFFGLYGVASPLPTYYTEDLLDEEREGRSVTREFLDIVHYAMYPLLFDAWAKYRLQHRIVEDEDQLALSRLYAFIGLDDSELRVALLPGSAGLLRYAGLLNQRPRSALGLRIMLADAFPFAQVSVDSCVPQVLDIASDQRCALGRQGHCLGQNAYLGCQIDDHAGRIRVRLADVPQGDFHQLLPGAPAYRRLQFLIKFYLIDPLDVEIEIHLRHADACAARTAGGAGSGAAKSSANRNWSRLGYDTWLDPQRADRPTRVTFNLSA